MVDITDYVVNGGGDANTNDHKKLMEKADMVIVDAQRRLNSMRKSDSIRPLGLSRPPVSLKKPVLRPLVSRPLVSRPPVSSSLSGSRPPTSVVPSSTVGGTHVAYINEPVIYMGKPSMGSRVLKSIAIAVAIVLIILILYHVFASESLVSKLEQSGWVVYYLRGCRYCTKQRQVFDGHYDNYVEINAHGRQVEGIDPPIPCNSPLLTGFPLWYNVYSREIKVGMQDKESLNMMVL